MVTRPVITSMAHTIRLHWRRVVAVTWGWRHCKSATISTIGVLRCGVGVVVLHNATLHDNGPPYLIFGEGIVKGENIDIPLGYTLGTFGFGNAFPYIPNNPSIFFDGLGGKQPLACNT